MTATSPIEDAGFLKSMFGETWAQHKRNLPPFVPEDQRDLVIRPDYKRRFQADKDERLITLYFAYALFWQRERQHVSIIEAVLQAAGVTRSLDLKDPVRVRLETDIPAPPSYCSRLQSIVAKHPVRYIRDRAGSPDRQGRPLEGPTQVDLHIVAGSATIIGEAKFLSDISYQTDYSSSRNQLARSIDIALETAPNANFAVLLITPRRFMPTGEEASARLYAYKFEEYRRDPKALCADLIHRPPEVVSQAAGRIGWISWEDLARIAFQAEATQPVWGPFGTEFRRFLDERKLNPASSEDGDGR